MPNKVIILSEGNVFLVGGIREALKQNKIDVIDARPNIQEITSARTDATAVIFFLGDYLKSIRKDLMFLRDMCLDDEKPIFAIGTNNQYEELMNVMPDSIIRGFFQRPINTNDLILAIEEWELKEQDSELKKKLLIVDDDPVFLRSDRSWLDDAYRVTIVNSGMNAITYMANHKPDLMLLDYEMPIADGKQILSMIRSDENIGDVPVIFLTGKDDKKSVMNVLPLNPEGYLLKTLSPSRIRFTIDRFFAERERKNLDFGY